ncbi:uncharacterized protein M6B38_384335 [Iris pallida]|uniref:Uncharacterized protein n=1 Tax=Iris pallida TaxID=29817 RepID=A0AAX6G4M4_IRIPA|nr:uncharacterized protein M6B38_384335 [Iris pallida]
MLPPRTFPGTMQKSDHFERQCPKSVHSNAAAAEANLIVVSPLPELFSALHLAKSTRLLPPLALTLQSERNPGRILLNHHTSTRPESAATSRSALRNPVNLQIIPFNIPHGSFDLLFTSISPTPICGLPCLYSHTPSRVPQDEEFSLANSWAILEGWAAPAEAPFESLSLIPPTQSLKRRKKTRIAAGMGMSVRSASS